MAGAIVKGSMNPGSEGSSAEGKQPDPDIRSLPDLYAIHTREHRKTMTLNALLAKRSTSSKKNFDFVLILANSNSSEKFQ
ncbi:hypothetical protein Hamer_G015742 [Homarus americanus]|uniref:Uncharacterized protein n=1 Tax=Homarus americanus TaxID=6706 RepID=A0A8J5N7I8_HOMAM|nr:hypothetical protein Hamer_G015742 [Homarus americanus]